MSRLTRTLLILSLLTPTSTRLLLAGEPEEQRLREVQQRLEALQKQIGAEQGSADNPLDREIGARQERLRQLAQESERFSAAGASEQDRGRIKEAIAQTQQELHDLQAHRPARFSNVASPRQEGQPGVDRGLEKAGRRIEHLRAAADHLQAAGADDLARQLIKQAQSLEQEVQRAKELISAQISEPPTPPRPATQTPASASTAATFNQRRSMALADQRDAKLPRPGLIAIQLRDQRGKMQIVTVNPDGSGKKQLTFEGDNGRPAWSPDGRTILFSSFRDGFFPRTTPSTWLMGADGSHQRMIAAGHAADCWSPDGAKIGYSKDGQIWIMDSDGKNEKQITTSKTFKSAPTWSHDGKQMAFILLKNPGSPTDPQPEIGIMNVDGTNERILTSQDRTNTLTIPDGTTVVLETANDANAPSWSPVESRIAFWSGIETKYGQVWSINADGTGSKQLTAEPNHRNNDDPSWSPDGKQIIFSTGRSGRNELWVMDADGKNEKRVSDVDAFPFPGRASWQPVIEDGRGEAEPRVNRHRAAIENRPGAGADEPARPLVEQAKSLGQEAPHAQEVISAQSADRSGHESQNTDIEAHLVELRHEVRRLQSEVDALRQQLSKP